MDESLKNYLVKEVNLGVVAVTRSGTGVSETSKLCRRCYQYLRRKKFDVTYTPQKHVQSSGQKSSVVTPSVPTASTDTNSVVKSTTKPTKMTFQNAFGVEKENPKKELS